MAFTAIPSTWIEVGKAIKKQLFTRISDNLDDHETRIDGLEGGANKVQIFNFEIIGYINHYTVAELAQIGTFRAPSNTTVTEVKITLMNATNGSTSSSAGILSVDLQRSLDGGATWATVLNEQPVIDDGVNATGSESGIVTFISGGEDVDADDLLRINVTSKKDTQGSFLVTVYGDVA